MELLSEWPIFTGTHHFRVNYDLLMGDGSSAMFDRWLLDKGMKVYRYIRNYAKKGDLSLLTQMDAIMGNARITF